MQKFADSLDTSVESPHADTGVATFTTEGIRSVIAVALPEFFSTRFFRQVSAIPIYHYYRALLGFVNEITSFRPSPQRPRIS